MQRVLLVALTCFFSASNARRVSMEPPPMASGAIGAMHARKRISSSQSDIWKRHGDKYMQDVKSVPALAAQPPASFDISDVKKCIGRDGVVPKKDYQIGTNQSTPNNVFTIDADEYRDTLAFRFRQDGQYGISDWMSERVLASIGTFRRDECCGQQAELFWEKESCPSTYRCTYRWRAKVKCIGATKGSKCRLRGWFGMLVGRSGCAKDFKCTKLNASDDDEVGECE
jgi:hypothetical protein